MATFVSIPFFNNNNQLITLGPVVDGAKYAQVPPVVQSVTDLVVTATMYVGRNIYDPATTPGTVVSSFGNGGSLTLPHIGNGVYQAQVSAFTVTPNAQYVMVFDAPTSQSGYQLHRERLIQVVTGSA